MKLEELKIKNFRGFKDEVTIPITRLTAFIGKNDAGKSSILEALEIFFNNDLVSCEKDDLNINADSKNIEITCLFSQIPQEITIDAAATTSLSEEYLLDSEGRLKIKKIFSATAVKPKESVYIVCNHPTVSGGNDLLNLKRQELRRRAEELGVSSSEYNANVNSSIRKAIWSNLEELNLQEVDLLVDMEDSKKVYEFIKKHLPIYALFQSDRKNNDDDKEVTDPMKIAINQALQGLDSEIEHIKEEVMRSAIDTANRTLEKLKEMSPELANELTPEFKIDPKLNSLFKLTIKSEDGILINKRGSGVRRLILLNFFRAEAEKLRSQSQGNSIIFAFEEPETSQHPDHQKMLVQAFLELANAGNSQVILTTHTPALAEMLPLDGLRFVEKSDSGRIVEQGNEDVFDKIVKTLGVLIEPISKNVKAMLLLEGKDDVIFVKHAAEKLKEAGHLSCDFQEKEIALIPVGGCGNLKHWITLKSAEQFGIPYCVMMDSDKGTNEEEKNLERIVELQGEGIKAYVTRKRELENYIHLDCLELPEGSQFCFSDICDAKYKIAAETATEKGKIIEKYWTRMTSEQIREVEKYTSEGNECFEFSDMFNDFFSLVD